MATGQLKDKKAIAGVRQGEQEKTAAKRHPEAAKGGGMFSLHEEVQSRHTFLERRQ